MSFARRWAAAVTLSALLAGCAAPDPLPMTATMTITPHLSSDFFVANDGARLPLRAWLPDGQVKTVILALHGFNDYSHAFVEAGDDWARQGIATYAYDQRGFGAAPLPGSWAGTYLLDADLSAVTRLLHQRYPGVPLYLLGESMGAAVIVTAEAGTAGAEPPAADGIILMAPAVWGWQTMNVFMRAALWTMDQIAPNWTFTGQSLHIQASDNIAMLRALGRDPLVMKATRVATIRGLVDLMSEAFAAAPRLKERMLLLHGAKDPIIPLDPVQKFVAALPPVPPGRRILAYYPKGYHLLLRDLDGAVVRRDIASWIADRDRALPSGADKAALAALTRHS